MNESCSFIKAAGQTIVLFLCCASMLLTILRKPAAISFAISSFSASNRIVRGIVPIHSEFSLLPDETYSRYLILY